jgi:serine/threonine protein kinase
MEERYQIIEKIGQGGLGAVYRAFDTRMNRDIAIKRISVPADDEDLQKESIRQLVKEAGALASLQHPHIVTIYDVGSDEEGPYVIMELISGKTLDEIIERAPLTWTDFREFALQTQEALIAAQELDMIHSDIKPPNIMLTWLPSGKFQVKIVDFGLATLTHGQSLEELQESEAIFGSIFFMAPEQFERVPVDARTDMYAMGCVYYQALTGTYPFQGETGYEVMVSHLHHKVIPLQEVRSDIPLWACEWIMWQINRMPDDRPGTARESLQSFLQNDKTMDPALSRGQSTAPVPLGPRPRRLAPGSKNTSAVNVDQAPGTGAVLLDNPTPSQAMKITAPQPLLPPEGFKPSIHTKTEEIKTETAQAPAPTPFNAATANLPTQTYHVHLEKKPMSMAAKIGIGAGALAALVIGGIILGGQLKASQAAKRYDAILSEAKAGTGPIQISGPELELLLSDLDNPTTSDTKLQNIISALARVKSNDGSNFDSQITKSIVESTKLLPEVQTQMIIEVIGKRADKSSAAALIDFARNPKKSKPARIAAFEAATPIFGDEQFDTMLSLIENALEPEIRKAAEDSAKEILRKTTNESQLRQLTSKIQQKLITTDTKFHEALLRLQGTAGGR